MATSFDVGDKDTAAKDLVQISVDPLQSETVTITNVSGDTLSYYNSVDSQAAGTLTPTNSQSFTAPVWINSAGRTSVLLTGGKY